MSMSIYLGGNAGNRNVSLLGASRLNNHADNEHHDTYRETDHERRGEVRGRMEPDVRQAVGLVPLDVVVARVTQAPGARPALPALADTAGVTAYSPFRSAALGTGAATSSSCLYALERDGVALLLVVGLVALDPLPRGTFGRRAADLLLRVVRVLVHSDVVDLVQGRLVHHVAEAGGEAALLPVVRRVAVVLLAGAVCGTLGEPPLRRHRGVHDNVAGLA
mmetsp:Transcript_41752/g.77240  ORF Transcript_41752/g.77240 Transcript_41752/m.77240 type:complete len:220 (+) Transcript_41752:760-1419(+)